MFARSLLTLSRLPQRSARYYSIAADHVVDLRSDTVTRPSQEMRQAMALAEVGDDVFGEDPTINELQAKMANILGKEAALYVPSGTMGNLVSIMSHCNSRGLEVLLGHKSHILLYEQGGIAQIAGVQPRTLTNADDGTFDIGELRDKLRPTHDPHQPWTKMVCLENSHNACGGKVVPLDFVKEVSDVCKEKGLMLHMDGARLFNTSAATGINPEVLVEHCDSVSVCFSKGLGCPVGSAIAGSKSFIQTALRCRKVLGGGLRQAGILAAAALYALDNNVPLLKADHFKAMHMAEVIASVEPQLVSVEDVDTNIILIHFHQPDVLNSPMFCQRLLEVMPDELKELGESVVVKAMVFGSERMARLVSHIDLTDDDLGKATAKMVYVLKEFAAKSGQLEGKMRE